MYILHVCVYVCVSLHTCMCLYVEAMHMPNVLLSFSPHYFLRQSLTEPETNLQDSLASEPQALLFLSYQC